MKQTKTINVNGFFKVININHSNIINDTNKNSLIKHFLTFKLNLIKTITLQLKEPSII